MSATTVANGFVLVELGGGQHFLLQAPPFLS